MMGGWIETGSITDQEDTVMMSESVERVEDFRASQMVVPAWMEQAMADAEMVRVVRKSALAMSWVVSVEPVR